MPRRLLFNSQSLAITIHRLCQVLIENHDNFDNTVLIGLQPRGIFFAKRIETALKTMLNKTICFGKLDVTFFRDDFRNATMPLKANTMHMPFTVEQKRVVLVDDVVYTGRTVRAALDALNTYGRPSQVELLVLINRKYTRHLPIEPNYIGRNVNTIQSQRVLVELTEQGKKNDQVWLINQKTAC